jgi:hypothetical protein
MSNIIIVMAKMILLAFIRFEFDREAIINLKIIIGPLSNPDQEEIPV